MMLQSEKMKVDQALANESNTATRDPKAHDNGPISREDALRKWSRKPQSPKLKVNQVTEGQINLNRF